MLAPHWSPIRERHRFHFYPSGRTPEEVRACDGKAEHCGLFATPTDFLDAVTKQGHRLLMCRGHTGYMLTILLVEHINVFNGR